MFYSGFIEFEGLGTLEQKLGAPGEAKLGPLMSSLLELVLMLSPRGSQVISAFQTKNYIIYPAISTHRMRSNRCSLFCNRFCHLSPVYITNCV